MFTNEIEDGREALQKPSLNKYLNYFFQKVRFLNTVVFKTIVFTNDRFQKRSFLKTIVLKKLVVLLTIVNDYPSLTIVNDDPSLTIVNDDLR